MQAEARTSITGLHSAPEDARLMFVTALALSAVALAARAVLEIGFKLPAPVGDSIVFLDPAANLCSRDFFGTSLIEFDPAGLDRYVWHGFVAPWLVATLNPTCSTSGFFAVGFAFKVLGLALSYFLARSYGLPRWQSLAAGLLTFATQSKLGFRPELVALPVILAVELAIRRERWSGAGALFGVLLWTQPTTFALYGLILLLVRPRSLWAALGAWPIAAFVASVLTLGWLYPFPLRDLMHGVMAQGAKLAGRTDGDLVEYYVVTHFLPAWSLLLVAALLLLVRTHPAALIALPALWWFGPRLPPTSYNLQVLLPCVVLLAASSVGRSGRFFLAIASMVVAVAGLAQSTLRDLATVVSAGDTYTTARDIYVRDLRDSGVEIVQPPIYSGLWLADLGSATPDERQAHSDAARTRAMVTYSHMAGRPRSPCPHQSPNARPFEVVGHTIFNSTSGWQTYRCEERLDDHEGGQSPRGRANRTAD